MKSSAVHFIIGLSNQWIINIPEDIWWYKLLGPFLSMTDVSILRRTSKFYERYWQHVFKQNSRVPQDIESKRTNDLALLFSERKVYTKVKPIKSRFE